MGSPIQDVSTQQAGQPNEEVAKRDPLAPAQPPSPQVRAAPNPGWGWVLLFLAAALVVGGVEKSLEAVLTPFEMSDLELSFSQNRARDVLCMWTEGCSPDSNAVISTAQQMVHWDDALIPLYVVAIILLVLRASATLVERCKDEKQKRWAATAGKVLATLVVASGLLDYVENFGLGSLLQAAAASPPGPVSPVIVYATSICALLKFILAGLAVAFCIGVFSTTDRARAAVSLLKRLWMHLVLVVGVGLMFLAVDQAQDILRAVAEAHGTFQGVLFYAAIALWTFGAWHWTRMMMVIPPASADRAAVDVALWLPRILAVSGGILMGLAFERAAGWPSGAMKDWPWALYIGGVATMALSVLVVWLCALTDGRPAESKLRKVVHSIAPLPFQHPSFTEAPSAMKLWGELGLLAAFALWAGFAAWPVGFGQALGPGATVLLLSAVAGLPIASALAYVEIKFSVPVGLWAAAMIVVFGTLGDSHRMRVLPGDKPPAGPALSQKAQAWLQHIPKEQRPPGAGPIPMYVVATEGGGIRAAYWTASVLGRLADSGGREFTDHLFAVSSVSGGSLGAAVYAAQMASAPNGDITPEAQKMLGRDLLSPVLGAMLAVDFPAAFFPPIPPPFSMDRALALEHSWEYAWRDVSRGTRNPFEEDFLELWSKPADRWVPSLFLNATVVESGKRIITSDVQIDPALFPDAKGTLDAEQNRVRLSTAAHLSARFAYVSPGASLPLGFYAVDGGYYDNSGATTLSDLLSALRASHPGGMRIGCKAGDDVCPIILFITNGPQDARPQPLQGFAQLRIPPEAVGQTRNARATYAVEQLLREAEDYGWRSVKCSLQDPKKQLPLGWMLSQTAQGVMNDQAEKIDFKGLGGCVTGAPCWCIPPAQTAAAPGISTPAPE